MQRPRHRDVVHRTAIELVDDRDGCVPGWSDQPTPVHHRVFETGVAVVLRVDDATVEIDRTNSGHSVLPPVERPADCRLVYAVDADRGMRAGAPMHRPPFWFAVETGGTRVDDQFATPCAERHSER